MSRARALGVDLAKLLNAGAAPVYVLDDERKIIFCNDACARWADVNSAELVGQRCEYHSSAELTGAQSVAAALCPPPKVFSGQVQSAVVTRVDGEGRLINRRGQFFPLSDGGDDSSPVLAILEQHDCDAGAEDGDSSESLDQQLHARLCEFRSQLADRFQVNTLLGGSPDLVRARAQIELAARARVHVLIRGEAGSGKDHVAKAIHYSQAEPGTLVPLACSVLETNLMRSTLRALWKKAVHSQEPVSLVLSDVDCLPPEAQSDLADVVRRGGGQLRVLSTSARPLLADGETTFSPELACALSTITIELPPLSRRLEDLPLLAQAFLEECNAGARKQLGGFSPEALDQLAAYPWPGNVDELAAVVRESHERAHRGEVTIRDLPKRLAWAADAAAHPRKIDEPIELEDFLAHVERELITRALRRAKNNKSKAAKLLGLTRPRLYRRLVQLGMEQPDGEPT